MISEYFLLDIQDSILIIEEIPVMLPDHIQDIEKDIEFLQKWHEKLVLQKKVNSY